MRVFYSFILTIFLISTSNCQIIKIDQDTDLVTYLPLLKEFNNNLHLEIPSNSKQLKKFETGKVILLNGDTICGRVEIINLGSDDEANFALSFEGDPFFPSNPNMQLELLPIKIRFTNSSDSSSIEIYRADKIIGFLKGERYYSSKRIKDSPSFYIEKILSGKINLYSYRYHYYEKNYVDYKIDYYIEGEKKYINKLDCSNIEKFIIEKFSDYPNFIAKTTEKQNNKKELSKKNLFVFNTCDYILEIVQLYNILKTEN